MSDEIPIGPNRCVTCGGEYGAHDKGCSSSNESSGSALPPKTDAYLRLNSFLEALRGELIAAIQKHAPMNSPHEGHSVIREELDELWDHVKADTGRTPAAIKEAMQIAAMGVRYAVDMSEPTTKE